MNDQTLVSVIIPTFNCGQYIEKAILSARRQSYRNMEIIVVDDGSTDSTRDIVSGLADETVRYIYQPNYGVAAARNAGLVAAKGEFVAYVDADDELDEQMIESCFNAVMTDDSEWCITDILKVRICDGVREEAAVSSPVPSSDHVYHILKDDFVLRAPFFRRATLIEIGMYDRRLLTREDWDMSIRAIRGKRKFSYIPKPLYKYYFRGSSLMRSRELLIFESTLIVLQKHHRAMADAGDSRAGKLYAASMWWLGHDFLARGHVFPKFAYCIYESLRYDFSLKRVVSPFLRRFKLASSAY